MGKYKSRMAKLIASTALLTTLLVGCGGGEQTTTDGNSDGSNEPVTLTMLISETHNTPAFQAVVAAIEEELNIKTEVELRPGGPEGENIMRTRLATGDMADLSSFNSGSLLKTLNPSQYFVDVANEPFMDSVFESYKETISEDGKVFGVPLDSSQVGGWLYNKRVYEELGLSVPETWDELMVNNQKIKDAGKTAVIGSYNTSWTSQLIILADYYNVQAQEPTFAEDYTAGQAKYASTPAALRGFEKLQEVYDNGFMNSDYNATTYDQAIAMLAEGDGVHYPMLTQALSVIANNFPDKIDDIGVFPQPGDTAGESGFTTWMPSVILISKDSDKIEAAKKWLEFYISPKGLEIVGSKSKGNGPFVIEGATIPDDAYPAVKEMVPYFEEGRIAPALEFVSPVKGPNLPQISAEVGGGISKAQDGAAMYDQDVERQAKQLGLPGW